MPALNYHHLFYFWNVVREGSEIRASQKLHVAQPTVSEQVRALERALGEKLFDREGRKLVITEMGQLVYQHANEIFLIGRDLEQTVRNRRPAGRALKVTVGMSDALPKLIAYRVLEPALHAVERFHVVCYENDPTVLVEQLLARDLDLVISDSVGSPTAARHITTHVLGTSGITFFAKRSLAARLRPAFPQSLNGAPLLLPTDNTPVRGLVETWLRDLGVRPLVLGEFQDGALLAFVGGRGVGVYPAPTAVEEDLRARFRVEVVGRVPEVRQHFFLITAERRIPHPATEVILEAARRALFSSERGRGSERD